MVAAPVTRQRHATRDSNVTLIFFMTVPRRQPVYTGSHLAHVHANPSATILMRHNPYAILDTSSALVLHFSHKEKPGAKTRPIASLRLAGPGGFSGRITTTSLPTGSLSRSQPCSKGDPVGSEGVAIRPETPPGPARRSDAIGLV